MNTPAFISQGIAFTSTERRVEMEKQAAAAREIAAVWNADIPEPTVWDLMLITKWADMNRREY